MPSGPVGGVVERCSGVERSLRACLVMWNSYAYVLLSTSYALQFLTWARDGGSRNVSRSRRTIQQRALDARGKHSRSWGLEGGFASAIKTRVEPCRSCEEKTGFFAAFYDQASKACAVTVSITALRQGDARRSR